MVSTRHIEMYRYLHVEKSSSKVYLNIDLSAIVYNSYHSPNFRFLVLHAAFDYIHSLEKWNSSEKRQ